MTRRTVVAIDEVDTDPERLETLSLQLRDKPPTTGPEGVARLTTGEALSQVVEAVRRWLGRSSGGRTVEPTSSDRRLRLTGASAVEQSRLINAFPEASEP